MRVSALVRIGFCRRHSRAGSLVCHLEKRRARVVRPSRRVSPLPPAPRLAPGCRRPVLGSTRSGQRARAGPDACPTARSQNTARPPSPTRPTMFMRHSVDAAASARRADDCSGVSTARQVRLVAGNVLRARAAPWPGVWKQSRAVQSFRGRLLENLMLFPVWPSRSSLINQARTGEGSFPNLVSVYSSFGDAKPRQARAGDCQMPESASQKRVINFVL